MTPKEQLIHEIELAPEPAIGELLEFWQLVKMRHHPLEQPLWSFIDDLVSDIPANVLATLPTDGAAEHDHYIYGTPKQRLTSA